MKFFYNNSISDFESDGSSWIVDPNINIADLVNTCNSEIICKNICLNFLWVFNLFF